MCSNAVKRQVVAGLGDRVTVMLESPEMVRSRKIASVGVEDAVGQGRASRAEGVVRGHREGRIGNTGEGASVEEVRRVVEIQGSHLLDSKSKVVLVGFPSR